MSNLSRSLLVPAAVLLGGLALGLSSRAETPTSAPPTAGSSATPVAADADVTAAPAPTATTTAAASTDTTAPDPKAQAQALLSEGNQLVAEADFGAALDKYRAAYELFPAPKLLINMGTALRHLGRNAEAAASYEAYLAHPESDPQRRTELQRILTELDQVTGRVRIKLADRDARVRLDGKVLEPQEWAKPRRVDPGDHTVVAEKAGFVTVVRTVAVKLRDDLEIPLVLLKPGQAPPVVIEAGAGDTQRVVGYVLGAAGIAALGVGAVFGGLALSTDSDAAEHCMAAEPSVCDAEGASLGDTARTQGTVSTVLLIGGGALLATGVMVWLTAPSDEAAVEPAEAALGVGVAPTGVRLLGRW